MWGIRLKDKSKVIDGVANINLLTITHMWSTIPAAALVAFLWGCAPYLHKNVSTGLDPRDFIICSGLSYSVLVFALMLTRLSVITRNGVFTRCNMRRVFLFTLFFIFIPNIAYVWALQNSTHIRSVTSVTYLAPLVTVLAGCMYFGDSVELKKILGVVLLVVGVFILRSD